MLVDSPNDHECDFVCAGVYVRIRTRLQSHFMQSSQSAPSPNSPAQYHLRSAQQIQKFNFSSAPTGGFFQSGGIYIYIYIYPLAFGLPATVHGSIDRWIDSFLALLSSFTDLWEVVWAPFRHHFETHFGVPWWSWEAFWRAWAPEWTQGKQRRKSIQKSCSWVLGGSSPRIHFGGKIGNKS